MNATRDDLPGIGVAAYIVMANANQTQQGKPDQGKSKQEQAPKQATPSPKIQQKPAMPTPRQSQVDEERADWEGMGQSQHTTTEE